MIPGILVERQFYDGSNAPLDLATAEVDTAASSDRERVFEFLRKHAKTGRGKVLIRLPS